MQRRTKVLATVGPASSDQAVLKAMIDAGADGFRLNFSHGSASEHAEVAEAIRAASQAARRPVAIVQDLQGPKLRLGAVENDEVTLEPGAEVRFELGRGEGSAGVLRLEHAEVFDSARPGARIHLGDGDVALTVGEVDKDAFVARVDTGGTVRTASGITLQDLVLPGGLTEKDQRDVLRGRDMGVDMIAASFVSSAADVADVRELLAAKGETTPVIAKIERRDGVDAIEDIARVADGILVARGDLGIALPPEQVPIAQKRILGLCERDGVLSITATQMLESMVHSARPTRAEASDVANAIVDGTHVVMLSGETAIGVDPARAVRTMASIAEATERAIVDGEIEGAWRRARPDGSQDDAISHAAVLLAEELGVKALVSFTSSGSTAVRAAKYRPRVGLVAATPVEATWRRLALVWGVRPALVPDANDLDGLVRSAEEAAQAMGLAETGETIVLTAGDIGAPGTTNLIRVAAVR